MDVDDAPLYRWLPLLIATAIFRDLACLSVSATSFCFGVGLSVLSSAMGAELEGSHEVKSNRGQLLSRSAPERLRRSLDSWFPHVDALSFSSS